MSHRYSIDKKEVKLADLEKHLVMFTVVSHILDAQSQPIVVVKANAKGLLFDLRVNLPEQAFERLIVKEINDNVPGYHVEADWKNRVMGVMKDAGTARKQKPVGDSGEIAA